MNIAKQRVTSPIYHHRRCCESLEESVQCRKVAVLAVVTDCGDCNKHTFAYDILCIMLYRFQDPSLEEHSLCIQLIDNQNVSPACRMCGERAETVISRMHCTCTASTRHGNTIRSPILSTGISARSVVLKVQQTGIILFAFIMILDQ